MKYHYFIITPSTRTTSLRRNELGTTPRQLQDPRVVVAVGHRKRPRSTTTARRHTTLPLPPELSHLRNMYPTQQWKLHRIALKERTRRRGCLHRPACLDACPSILHRSCHLHSFPCHPHQDGCRSSTVFRGINRAPTPPPVDTRRQSYPPTLEYCP